MALSDTSSVEGETPPDLQTELKDLMKQIIHEAMTQPEIKEGNGNGHLSWPPTGMDSLDSLGQRSYEDILATAILNKIFAKYQLDRPKRKHKSNERTFDKNSNLLSGETQRQGDMSRSETDDSDSVANSLDDNSWSDYNNGPMSVTIEECIEEVTTRYSSDDEDEPKSDMDKFLSSLKYIKRQRAPFPELGKDIIDGGLSSSEEEGEKDERHKGVRQRRDADTDSMSTSVEQLNPVDSWEENWLFQRRRLKTNMGTCQPVPVPMLVPNPSSEYRAMIGDVDADETSDLSDCSDSVLEDLIDGPDDKKYFERQNQQEESDEEKQDEAVDKQRELFLQYISEDLNKLIEPTTGGRGLSPDVSSCSDVGMTSEVIKSPDTGQETMATPAQEQEIQATSVAEQSSVNEVSSVSPETESSNSYSIVETRNLSVPVVQVDSVFTGEGSLDIQQDSEYTVAYATLAQVRQTPSPSPTTSPSPKPKPRTVLPSTTPSEQSSNDEVLREDKTEDNLSAIDILSLPPKPGTIAEREHLKWEKAPPLANNPYSRENIARRQRQRMYLSRHSSSENSIEFPELTGTKEPSLLEIDSKHRREDYNKYVRDYYVNVTEGQEEEEVKQPVRPSSAEPRIPPRLSNSCSSIPQQQVSVRVEVEVAVTKPCAKSGTVTPTQTTAQHWHQAQVMTVVTPDDDEYISLPSVRELAKQFSTPDEKIPVPTSPIPAKKQMELRLHSPVRQVHSLTARNISREFRENLRGGKLAQVAVVKVADSSKDKDKEQDSSGHVSEDSGTVSPTLCPPPRRIKLQEDIQFWEKLKQQR